MQTLSTSTKMPNSFSFHSADKNLSGLLVTDLKDINEIFKTFYSSLYCSESSFNTTDMTSFLKNHEAPTLDPEASEALDSPLS